MDKNTLSHTRWECKYHIVFAPKYRRQVIYGKIREDICEILTSLCKRKGVEIIEETSKAFISVVEGVDTAVTNTNSVVMSVSEQNLLIQDVDDKTQIIASGVEESNSAVSEVTATVSHLQKRAEQLQNIVRQFKA